MSLRILLLHDECTMGGHTSFMLGLARGLRERGHRVLSYFFRDGGHLREYSRHAATACGDVSTLRELLRGERFDVAHGDSCMQDLPRSLRRAGYRGPLVLTRHSWNAPPGWHSGLCDALVAVSPSSAELIQPLTDLGVECIPNGIDVEFFQPSTQGVVPAKPVIAWCGRSPDPVKNLARYLSITWNMDPERYLFWVADGDLPDDLDAFRRASGGGHVSSWRRYKREELREFFSHVSRSGGCVLATSRCETLGLALLEAMACGCPVIGAQVPGTRDVLGDELREWSYPTEQADEEIARFVEAALPRFREPAVRAEFRERVVHSFSQQAMVTGYVDLYERLLRGERKPGPAKAGRELADRLWLSAASLVKEGRQRDSLFAARGAVRMSPGSLLGAGRASLLLRTAGASRLRGAHYFLERARDGFAARRYLAGARELAHALMLHPGAPFLRSRGESR